ncbi:trigger factor [Arcanobacterium wilhelmae]|uniref:Trigger factor n=1 Tax=Arcanobacterium wilhelmae TaxID=1803177 RepID=A0ABT9NA07_9ACTO|nr:trigger factor [Arcanobacterium wilhelmae]MDP9800358.1 trigger factor [Arcanobacterium wilhelmae]WFN89793.1 trigger factor [Arcanobacterium wilhelmae]
MKNSVEFLSATRANVTIEVAADEFAAAYDKSVKEAGKQITIPGFRKGKAPRRVLEANLDKHYLIDQTINDNLDKYYQTAMNELGLVPMAQPEVDLDSHPEMTGKSDDNPLRVLINVVVRPEIIMPNPADVTLTLESTDVTDEDVENELTDLRQRFASLKDVKRAAKEGDFVNIDLVATIDGEEIDDVSGISYKIGDGSMLDGQDEALTGAKAGDVVEFTAAMKGGEHEGEEGDVKITVHSVKEQELPEADDDFAQMASEFDTIDELKKDLAETAKNNKAEAQIVDAQTELLKQLLEASDFALPEGVVEAEIANHLKQEGKTADDAHADEIRGDVEEALRTQLLLDEYAEAFGVQVEQDELLNFLVQQAQAYGMDPNQFIQAAVQTNQVNVFAGEVARNKALLTALRFANVVDAKGEKFDVAEVIGERDEKEKDFDFGAQKATRKVSAKAPKAERKADKPAKAEKKAEETKADKPAKAEKKAAAGDFDPADHKVDEVLAYLESADDAEKARVIKAEEEGKGRKTILAKA